MVLLHPVILARHRCHLLDQSVVHETRLSIEIQRKSYKDRQRWYQESESNLQERDYDFVRHTDCFLGCIRSERRLGFQKVRFDTPTGFLKTLLIALDRSHL